MSDYLLRRTLHSMISLVCLVALIFVLARLTGNPADLYLPLDTPQAIREEFIRLHGFDDPLWVQFGRFVAGVVQLDFGTSLRLSRPGLEVALEAFPTTLILALVSMAGALLVAIVVGAIAAFRPNGAVDRLASLISLVGVSLPNFWLAIVGILVFAVQLRWLPTFGSSTPIHWILPLAVLFIRPCGVLVQVVRGAMIDVLSSPFIKTAVAKGATDRRIIFIHALRNAMLPVITVAGDQAAGIINGAIVIETVFGLPGIGRVMIEAINNRDFAVLQAAVVVTAVAIFLTNLLIDLIYLLLDPRVRHS